MFKDDKKRTHIIVTGKGGGGGSDAGAVRFDEAQTLTSAEQLQARENIGAISQEDVLNYKQIPSEWDTAHTMADLIADIAADNNAVEGKSYMGTVSLSDLPASLLQGEIMIDIMSVDENLGKNVRFTLTSSNTAPYHWEYTSAYGATGTWRGFVVDGSLATVATSGDYTDLTNKPTIPAAQVNSDWNAVSGVSQILNKPSLATVATSGNYSDLNGTPSLATVATSGDYDDLQNKPTIPAAPVQSDWNESDSSSLAYIANKPTIPAAQVQSDWNQSDNTQADYIKNKPNITPTPPMSTETLTFTLQGGTTKTIEFYTVPNYFYVEDVSGSNNTLTIKNYSNTNPVEVFKSTDRTNWTSMGTTNSTGITATIPANSKLYLKANTNNFGGERNANTITASGNHNVGGNTMSLMYGDNFENKTVFPTGSDSNLSGVFNGNIKLKNANNLVLPATTLTAVCYYKMFYGCNSLVTAPQSLPATTLTIACYSDMFNGCTSLTTAPVISATTHSNNCCQQMFKGCTSLTTAPVLLATTLVQNSYNGMFDDCRNLNSVTTYAQNISGDGCIYQWLSGVSATGDFYNLGGATYPSGGSGIPSGWTEHNTL